LFEWGLLPPGSWLGINGKRGPPEGGGGGFGGGSPAIKVSRSLQRDASHVSHVSHLACIHARIVSHVSRDTLERHPHTHTLSRFFFQSHRYSQSHLGWHFWKLKAQSSNVSFATFQWKEMFELWDLSFETAFQNAPKVESAVVEYYSLNGESLLSHPEPHTHTDTHTLTHPPTPTRARALSLSFFTGGRRSPQFQWGVCRGACVIPHPHTYTTYTHTHTPSNPHPLSLSFYKRR